MPTSAHTCFRAVNGEERGGPSTFTTPQRSTLPPISGGRRDASSPPVFKSAGRRAQARSRGHGRVRASWLAGPRRSRKGAARLRMGGEEECAPMRNSNPGCNYLVRGYCPSMHFFWGGDMPYYSPPLFSAGPSGVQVVAGQTARVPGAEVADVHAGWRAQARAPGRVHAGPRARAPTCPLGCHSPAHLASLCSPFSVVFPFLDR